MPFAHFIMLGALLERYSLTSDPIESHFFTILMLCILFKMIIAIFDFDYFGRGFLNNFFSIL